ncbi:MAG: hypothetical protein MK515_10395 [SAR324 cluster bacterium]|jgi:hypothetical protein|nr:hypothetical protein [SAR324 cluster bacterium]MCH2266857.1 hypothetical protein [SAR324 cluster bacterium]
MVSLEQVLEEAQKNDRVCPQPKKWNKLYEMLPNRKRKGNGWKPALPLILAAWWDTPTMLKTLRLREHIEWASEHNCLDAIYEFMKNLKEEEWFHIGE